MSMQRSISAFIALIFFPCATISPVFLDELNEFFAIHVWSINDFTPEDQKDKNTTDYPRYEREIPGEPEEVNKEEQKPNHKRPRAPRPQPEKSLVLKDHEIRFNNVVGQEEAVANLRAVVEQFKNPSRLRLFGGENKKGILLAGPPGTGKTMLARAVANELGYSFHECSASSFVEVFVGTGAQRVRELFAAAHRSAPAVVFIDEIDAAAGKRGEGTNGGDNEYKQTTIELLTQMNKLNHDTNILVITATNCIEQVDEAFKAPHRFEIVNVGLPTPEGRAATLRNYLNRLPRVAVTDDAIATTVEKTRSFSQSQLKSVVNGAVQMAIGDKEATKVTDVHLLAALEQARAAMKTGMFGTSSTEHDKVSFSDIAGLEEVINEFKFLVYALKHPDRLKELGVEPPKGILLVGKPGCGKTMLVRALANEAHCQVIGCSGGSFDTKFMGEGAQEIRRLFTSAGMISPCILFIDEIDAITSPQSVNELLTQMDGFVKQNGVVVIGATNHLQAVDYRLRREGRFSRILPIALPNEAERRKIFELYIDKLPKVDKASVPLDTLVFYTHNFSGAGLKNIINDAAMYACIENAPEVGESHFHRALERAIQSRAQRSQDDD